MSATASTEDRVRTVIATELAFELARIKPTDRLLEDLGIDSFDFMELVMAVEEEFNITIHDDEADKFRTVQDIADHVGRVALGTEGVERL